MPRLTLLLLTLGLLAAPYPPAGGVLRSVGDLLSFDSGREMDPTPTSSESDPDRGWEIDPNG